MKTIYLLSHKSIRINAGKPIVLGEKWENLPIKKTHKAQAMAFGVEKVALSEHVFLWFDVTKVLIAIQVLGNAFLKLGNVKIMQKSPEKLQQILTQKNFFSTTDGEIIVEGNRAAITEFCLVSEAFKTYQRKVRQQQSLFLLLSQREIVEQLKQNADEFWFIDISKQQFSHFPEEILLCKNLLQLNVPFNEISYLPDEICQLKNLHSLNVSGNPLEYLPSEPHFTQNLTHLVLNNMPFFDFAYFFENNLLQYIQLENLALTHCKFSFFPKNLIKLSQLKTLDVRYSLWERYADELQAYLPYCTIITQYTK
ncbi:MAG: hypothetical protein R2798_09385 [Chitinophagales bacterium]|nr:leucine-rich repeat domain-containing protein [Bacteroidota bacterium]MCB9043389.1 leucine-rich repeat domain-containing protein [Chitinophagales bacterium]